MIIESGEIQVAPGKEIGEFDYKVTSTTVAEDGQGHRVVSVNAEGGASGYGTVFGTFTLHGVEGDAKSGKAIWRAMAFLESGERATDTAVGTWHESGQSQWRFRGLSHVSDGATFAGDGILDMAARTFKGKLIEWD